MRILILTFIFLISVSVEANASKCFDALAVLHSTFGHHIDGLDEVVAEQLSHQVSSLGPEQAQKYSTILSRIDWIDNMPAYAMIVSFFGMNPRAILMNTAIRNHPLGRIALMHELNHLQRKLPKDRKEVAKQIFLHLTDINLILKDESEAYSAEYDFLQAARRKGVSLTDSSMYSTLSRAETLELRKLGVLTDKGNLNLKTAETLKESSDPSTSAIIDKLIITRLNSEYLESVNDAMNFDKNTYVQKRIQSYQGQNTLRQGFLALVHAILAVGIMHFIFGIM